MSEPMRVLHVFGIMNQGGAETMIMNLYRQVDRKKIQFDFVENENDGAFFDNEIRNLGGQIYHCPSFTGFNYVKYRKWWRDFFDTHKEHSIVHGHVGRTASIYLKEAKNHGIVTIAHSHSTFTKGFVRPLYSIYSYPTRYIADYYFMCSRRAGIDRFGKSAAESERAFLIPNAVETELFCFNKKARENKRQELGIDNNEYVIGHVGRFIEVKNHSYLLEIFRKAVEIHPSLRLLLVGDGELHQSVEEKVSSSGLQKKVIFAGNRSDVNELLSAMDVLVFPSKSEGLPVTLVEAQCSGLPCVISDNIPEDSILIKELVHVLSLKDDPSVWAEKALQCNQINRSDCADKIKEAGFDAEKNVEWLEEFYLEKAR